MNAIEKAIELAGGPSKVAAVLGATPTAVGFWRDGKRRFPPELAARLEQAANNRIRRWQMFPEHWHLIWPELIGTEGAPAVMALETEARHAA